MKTYQNLGRFFVCKFCRKKGVSIKFIMEKVKTLKDYCKEAKKRLKSGFWQNYQNDLNNSIINAKNNGVLESNVKEYFSTEVSKTVKNNFDVEEDFYIKVKELLDKEGEVSDAIGRLTDKQFFDSLDYEEKQRYTLSLSEKYLKALERYKKEKALMIEEN